MDTLPESLRPHPRSSRCPLAAAMALLLVLSLAPPTRAQSPTYPPYSLFSTQIRFVYSQQVGRLFKIFVNLPRSYDREKERRYPTLYVLDPGAHFGMVTDIQRLLEDGHRIEPVLTVGIGYESVVLDTLAKYRTIDMLPTPGQDGVGGGAPQFLAFISGELIPFIEREYRVSPQRAIWGGSYGGLFGAYVLLRRPELFSYYLLNSPVLGHDHNLLFGYEEDLARTRQDLPVRVYLAAGGEEWDWMLGPLRAFTAQLEGRRYPGLDLAVEVVPGEDHWSIAPIGITRGLKRMFGLKE